MPSRKNYDPAEFTPDQITVESQSDPFPVDPVSADASITQQAAYGRETLVGATVVYKGEKNSLVKLLNKYGIVATADLTGDDLTMVNAKTLQAPPAIPSPTIELYPLLWQAGITDPATATREQLQTFHRLVLIAANKAVKG